MNHRCFMLISVLLLQLLAGCAVFRPPHLQDVSTPIDRHILAELFRLENKETLRAVASITVRQQPGSLHSQRMALAASHPARLKLESLPVFGVPDLFLSLINDSFKLYMPADEKFYSGLATKDRLYSFLNLYLSPREIVALVTGTPPIEPSSFDTTHLQSYGNIDGGSRIHVLSDERHLQSIHLNSNHEMTKVEVYNQHGRIRYHASFSNYLEKQNRSYPARIEVSIEEYIPTRIDIQLHDAIVTQDNDASVFDLPIPSGVEVIRMN